MRDYSGYIIGAVILGMGILSFPLTAENNLIPGILGKRDFDFDYAYFHETAVEVLDHYSPDWKNDYPPSSPVIASVNYETNESREKIVIVLFEGFDGGFANVIFLVDNQESGSDIRILDQLDIRETLLIDFSLETDYSYFEDKIPQLMHSYYMYNKYRDQINRDMKS